MISARILLLSFLILPGRYAFAQLCAKRPGNAKGFASTRLANDNHNRIPFCSGSVDNLCTGRSIPGSSGVPYQLPSWINLTLAHLGQKFARKHALSFEFSMLYGAITILTVPDTKDVLLFTKNSETILDVLKRYVATSNHLHIYWTDTLKLDVDNNAFLTSIAYIRAMHTNAAHRASKHGHPLTNVSDFKNVKLDNKLWLAFESDLRDSKIPSNQRRFSKKYHQFDSNPIPINQFAMALTGFASAGYLILKPSEFFLYGKPRKLDEDLKGVVHLAAVVNYALGVEDEFNIFLQPDVKSTRAYLKEVHEKYFNPGYFNLDKPTKFLIQNTAKGFNELVPSMGSKLLLLRLLRDHIGIPVPHMTSILTKADRAFQAGYNNVFLPLSHRRRFPEITSAILLNGIDAAVVVFYGPQLTNMDKAKNVFYNGTAGVSWIPGSGRQRLWKWRGLQSPFDLLKVQQLKASNKL